MRALNYLAFVGAILAGVTASAQASDMIATSELPKQIVTPYTTAEGKPIVAIPVRFVRVEGDTVDAVPISASSMNDQEGLSQGPVMSLKVSNAMIVSASFGWVFGEGSRESGEGLVWHRAGILAEGELGLGGVKASLGAIDEDGFVILPFGLDFKVSVMRTFGLSWSAKENSNYIGGEADFYLLLVKLSLGYFHETDGDDSFWNLGAGFGF